MRQNCEVASNGRPFISAGLGIRRDINFGNAPITNVLFEILPGSGTGSKDAGPSIPMATHKFRVGEKVQFLAGPGVGFATAEVYEIVQQLPESGGEYQYKIRSSDEPHLRMVKESQLRRA